MSSDSSANTRRRILFWPRRLQPEITTIIAETGAFADLENADITLLPFRTSEESTRDALGHALISAPASYRSLLNTACDSSLTHPAAVYDQPILGNAWHEGAHFVFYWLGTPEAVIQRSDLTENEREQLLARSRRLTIEGNLVYAVATSRQEHGSTAALHSVKPTDLTFLGLVACRLQLHPGTEQAIRFCKQNGIRIVYASTDNELTVNAVAHRAKLLGSHDVPFRYAPGIPIPEATVYASLDSSALRRLSEKYDPTVTLITSDPLPEIAHTITIR